MIRIGIIGCGRILAAHLRGYRVLRELGFDDFRITALCSRKETDALSYVSRKSGPPQRKPVSDVPGDPLAIGDEYLSDFQDSDNVKVFADYRQLIADPSVDAINDFSTHALHHDIATAAFNAGKDLLTQKPLAVTIKAGRRMCDLAEQKGCVFGVFENARFRPGTRHLHWLFHGGPGGTLQLAISANIGRWWAPNLIVAETPWRHRILEAGGITLDLGVHQFNVIRYLAGPILSVDGRTGVIEPKRVAVNEEGVITETMACDADDTCFASFETEAGVQGSLTASWAGAGSASSIGPGMIFHGTGGKAAGDEFIDVDGKVRSLRQGYEKHADPEFQSRDFPIKTDDNFALTQHDWLEAVRQRKKPEIDGWEGLMDLACAYAVLESSLAKRRVNVQDVWDGSVDNYQKPLNQHFGIE